MSELARQVRYVTGVAARKQLERVEELARDLLLGTREHDAPASFPLSWVEYRITGLMREPAADVATGGTIERAELMSDLDALTQRLSQRADLEPGEHSGEAFLLAGQVQTRWSCSRKSVERAQRSGLVSRRLQRSDGVEQIVFSAAVVEAFESSGLRERVGERGGGGSSTRLSREQREGIVRRARACRSRFGWSLDKVASKLAQRLGCSRQVVRRVLLAHDDGAEAPIFVRPSASGSKSKSLRDRRLHRLRLLRGFELEVIGGVREVEGSLEQWLAPLIVREGLCVPRPVPLGELLAMAARPRSLSGTQERAVGCACAALLNDVTSRIGTISTLHPSSAGLDVCETRLRHAGRLMGRLVVDELSLVVRTIETQIGAPAMTLGVRTLYSVSRVGIAALIESLKLYDPLKGGRLAAPASLHVGRAVLAALREAREKAAAEVRPKAIARSASVDTDTNVWDGVVVPWQSVLEPPPAVLQRIEALSERPRALLVARFGLDGAPPVTIEQLSARLGRPAVRVSAEERRAREDVGWGG